MLQIETDQQQQGLCLKGELDAHTLHTIWSQQKDLLTLVKRIDVTDLVRVDSSGLALLVYFCHQYRVKLIGVSAQLQALIELYDLKKLLDE